ncbi:coproporphyrinogen III oxidase family protein [bacterium]|nr:coproporphyrinogen III oxidase family protein [bacterium]
MFLKPRRSSIGVSENMSMELITRSIRRYLVGPQQEFIFKRAESIDLGRIESIDLYIHIPFCKNLCPYCPYNKIKYDESYSKPYLEAILNEIEMYYEKLGAVNIDSIYIGGGTPTNLIDELGVILERVRKRFRVSGNVCIETNPNDIDQENVNKLKDFGIDLISLGVQSFDPKYLALIGRNYSVKQAYDAIDLVNRSDFKSVNIDLMFALPGQTISELRSDVNRAMSSGANQLTTYPLFTFPYTSVGKYMKLKKVHMPGIRIRRSMYRTIHTMCSDNDFGRVSVWGFKRFSAPRYSSVTRDNYIGLGAGAGSNIPGTYYMNTFSVSDYMELCAEDRFPTALKMEFSREMTAFHWFYWRLYDTRIPKEGIKGYSGKTGRKMRQMIFAMKALNMCTENDAEILLNERGAFWLHLMQNYFSLNYINKVWTVAQRIPFPKEIRI